MRKLPPDHETSACCRLYTRLRPLQSALTVCRLCACPAKARRPDNSHYPQLLDAPTRTSMTTKRNLCRVHPPTHPPNRRSYVGEPGVRVTCPKSSSATS